VRGALAGRQPVAPGASPWWTWGIVIDSGRPMPAS